MMNAYRPRYYLGGEVLLITADHAFGKGLDVVPDHGWEDLVPAQHMKHRAITSASHYTILEPPHVEDLVSILTIGEGSCPG
jgi:hypothetical protein